MPTTELGDAVDVMLDFFATAADGRADDESVPVGAYVVAMANVVGARVPEVAPMTAGELRRRVAAAKARESLPDESETP